MKLMSTSLQLHLILSLSEDGVSQKKEIKLKVVFPARYQLSLPLNQQ